MDLSIFYKVENDIIKRELIHPSDRILLMVSGGRDSVFLLYFFDYLRKKIEIEISVFHLNHMLRSNEALRDEKFTRNLSEKLGFPFFSKEVNVKKIVMKTNKNLESIARDVRYENAEELRKKLNYDLIATAHTKTDFFETVLMHLIRGDSIYGLLGIAYRNGKIIRPILSVNRGEVSEFLRKNDFEWMDDSTNYETTYVRNYIRKVIAPHFKKIGGENFDDKILNSSLILRDYVNIAENYIRKEIKKLVRIKNNKLHLDLMGFFHYNGEERRLIIVRMLKLMGVNYSRNLIDIIEGFFTGNSDRYNYNNMIKCSKTDQEAVIWQDSIYKYYVNVGEKLKTDNFDLKVEICEKCYFEKLRNKLYFPMDKIALPVIVRNSEQGDRMIPFGHKSHRKLKDIFNGEGIPLWERDEYPVILSGNEIIGIMGVRRSALYPVNNGQNMIVIEYRRINENKKIHQ